MTTDEEANAIFEDIAWRAGTLFRALDTDGDGVLSPEEIAAAPDVLRALDTDADGYLRESDFGGPTPIYGVVRRSQIVRMLDEDGDMVIGPDDIAAASERILLLDFDGDGRVTAADDLPPPSTNMENTMPMGTPAQRLEFEHKMFDRPEVLTGPLPPGADDRVQPGFLLIQEMNDRSDVQVSKKMFLMDDRGNTVQEWHTPYQTPEATVAYLLPDGNLMRATCKQHYLVQEEQFPVGGHGCITIEAPDSTILWEYEHYFPGRECTHHDLEMMPNGNILMVVWVEVGAAEANAAGWVQQGDRPRIIADKIIEVKPDYESGRGGEIVWEWSVMDHLVQNADPTKPNFGEPSEHPERIDINWAQLDEIQFNYNQFIHMNSVSYNAEEDLLLLSSAIFGEAWIVDHSTTREEAAGSAGGSHGKGGDLLWRWGNPQTYGRGGPAENIMYWQHDTYWLPDNVPHSGDMMVFNNGMRRDANGNADYDQICMGMVDGAFADVLELTLPRDAEGRIVMEGESGATAAVVWNFNSDGAHDVYSPFMSNAQRLPNGNTVMVQACDKRIVEVTHGGEVVLDFHLPGPGRMFRVYKYAPDYPGITALGL